MTKGKVTIAGKTEVLEIIKEKLSHQERLELVITAGAGDIDTLVDPLRIILDEAPVN